MAGQGVNIQVECSLSQSKQTQTGGNQYTHQRVRGWETDSQGETERKIERDTQRECEGEKCSHISKKAILLLANFVHWHGRPADDPATICYQCNYDSDQVV